MQMKKFLLFLVAAILATVARAAVGDTFTYQGLNFEVTSEDDHTVKVGRYNDVSGDISIPSFAVNGSSRYFVTGIGANAFNSCSNLTSISIPNSVTEIGYYAFYSCSNLTSVNIPDAVTQIGEYAFSRCSSLTSINIPDAVTKIGKRTFYSCSSLTSVSIPDAVTEIGEWAFSECSSLTSVNIPNAVTQIETGVFCACSSLTSINIPDAVTQIGESAFLKCSSLTSINIPDAVTQIEISAFEDCSSLSEIVVGNGNSNYSSEDGVLFNINKTELIKCPGGKKGEYSIPTSVNEICDSAFSTCAKLTSVYIPNSVTEIGQSAFEDCYSLTSANIPNSVTQIEAHTFDDCSSLTSVYIPNSVTQIGERAFSGCRSLTSANIPNSVTTIREGTFIFCENLKTIYDLNPKPQSVEENAFKYVPEDAIIYVPKGSYNDYFLSSDWIHFSNFREMGAFDVALSEQTLDLTAGNTATITATVTKDDDMTVASEEWNSSNPQVATVDNGVITAVAPGEAVIWFTAVAANGLTCIESCTVTVSQNSGVAEIVTDTDAPVDVYNLQGVAVLRNAAATELCNLPAGLYIVRQGKSVKKIIVK